MRLARIGNVSAVLREPRRLALEYERRRTQTPSQAESLHWLEQQQAKEQRALARLIDAYESGLLEKQEFAPRLERIRGRLQDWQTRLDQLHEAKAQEQTIEEALGRLEDFAARIETGLREPTPQQQREILRALVKRVEIAPDKIRVIYKIAGVRVVVSGEEEFVRSTRDDAYDCLVSDADHFRSGSWLDQHLRIVQHDGFLFFHDTNQPRMFPGLATIEGQIQERGLPHFHFKESSRPEERCQRGWLFVINKKK